MKDIPIQPISLKSSIFLICSGERVPKISLRGRPGWKPEILIPAEEADRIVKNKARIKKILFSSLLESFKKIEYPKMKTEKAEKISKKMKKLTINFYSSDFLIDKLESYFQRFGR